MGLILASSSPRRREILKNAGYEFKIIEPNSDENVQDTLSPKQMVEKISQKKAHSVFGSCPNDTVLAADTIVVFGGRILGKPHDENDAFRMLRLLSGQTHEVYTGVCILNGNLETVFSEKTSVDFYDLSDDEIKQYIATKEPMDKAGAYGIQGFGSLFIRSIDGDFYNVMGLPISRTARELAKFGGGFGGLIH